MNYTKLFYWLTVADLERMSIDSTFSNIILNK